MSSKFIIVENSEASGHLYEIPQVTKMAECVTVILEEEGKGSTWMFEDAYSKHKHWRKFRYKPKRFAVAIKDAVQWADQFVKVFGQFQREALPWLQESEEKTIRSQKRANWASTCSLRSVGKGQGCSFWLKSGGSILEIGRKWRNRKRNWKLNTM